MPPRLYVSIQLIAPASGAQRRDNAGSQGRRDFTVSIQLIAPASGAWRPYQNQKRTEAVSIQLIAPASGAALLRNT